MNTTNGLLIILVAGIYTCESKKKNKFWLKGDNEEKRKTSSLLKLETFDTETIPINKKYKPEHRLANSWYVSPFSSLVKYSPGTFWSKRSMEVKNKTIWKLKTLQSETYPNFTL